MENCQSKSASLIRLVSAHVSHECQERGELRWRAFKNEDIADTGILQLHINND